MEPKSVKPILFLNSPVEDIDADIIGMEPYVEQLNAAIDAGAQVIAVTSPFGAGKTSLIELLKRRRAKPPKYRILAWLVNHMPAFIKDAFRKEWMIEVSMWLQLPKKVSELQPIQLHKTFVYQLVSQISPRTGTYINRRLSKNFGLLGLYTKRAAYSVAAFVALILLAGSWLLHTYEESFQQVFPNLLEDTQPLKLALLILAAILGALVVMNAGILFSSKRSEGAREIDVDEVLDLYRTEVLRRHHLRRRHYIVVIEDLDRASSDQTAAIGFLRELRRYCVQKSDGGHNQNQVTFIVNIMPEASLFKNAGQETEQKTPQETNRVMQGSRYAKLFDFVLDLQTINVDNYDSILLGLLQEKQEELEALGFSTQESLLEIPGIQWIIREPKLGIREVKERLNKAFLLYQSLQTKFGEKGISFEHCAVVAYLTTAFEEDYNKTHDRDFEKLIQLYLKNEAAGNEAYASILGDVSSDYISTVRELVATKRIDNNYRTYFYNYPKSSHLYSSDELQVLNAILYKEGSPYLDEAAQKVVQAGSDVTADAFKKLQQLGLPLPDVVLETDSLYTESLRLCFPLVVQRIKKFSYSDSDIDETIPRIMRMLHFDANRQVYDAHYAADFCQVWSSFIVSAKTFLQLRKQLCVHFSEEILWYKPLFFSPHPLITAGEMDFLQLSAILPLIDLEHEDFSMDTVGAVLARFRSEDVPDTLGSAVESLLRSALDSINKDDMTPALMDYMSFTQTLPADFETIIFGQLQGDDLSAAQKDALFNQYQNLICLLAEKQDLTNQTLTYIAKLYRYKGYTVKVAAQLNAHGFYLTYTLVSLYLDEPIDFERSEIKECLQKNLNWLLARSDMFLRLRKAVIQNAPSPAAYAFLFGETCPVMSQEELEEMVLSHGDCDELVMSLVPPSLVTEDTALQLAAFFSRKNQPNAHTFNILLYIATLETVPAKECFDALDFKNVRYRHISAVRKKEVKEAFHEILALDTDEGKLHFMEKTGFLESGWEAQILSSLNENTDMQKRYVNLINRVDKLTPATGKTYSQLSLSHRTSAQVLQRLFEEKRYTFYVASKVLNDGRRFVPEEGERGEILWPTYLSIFKHTGWEWLREVMTKNQDFLRRVMQGGSFTDMADENRLQLCGILQDEASVREVFGRGADFALRYFLQVGGFQDRAAADSFVNLLRKAPELLASDELYQHTHDMLVDPVLKGSYTRARKKGEYQQ